MATSANNFNSNNQDYSTSSAYFKTSQSLSLNNQANNNNNYLNSAATSGTGPNVLATSKLGFLVNGASAGATGTPNRQAHNRLRSSEPAGLKLSVEQLSNFSSNENIKPYDRLWDQVQQQIQFYNEINNLQYNDQEFVKTPVAPMKNAKEALRYLVKFNQQLLNKMSNQGQELNILRDVDQTATQLTQTQKQLAIYQDIWQGFLDISGFKISTLLDEGEIDKTKVLCEIQAQYQEKEIIRNRLMRELESKVEIQSVIISELMRSSEALKTDINSNKTMMLLQTQGLASAMGEDGAGGSSKLISQLSIPTESSQMENTGGLNLRDTNDNNEIEQLMLNYREPSRQDKSQAARMGTQSSKHGGGPDSPLTKALFFNETNTMQNIEITELKNTIQEYKTHYVLKAFVVQILEKLRETFDHADIADTQCFTDFIKTFEKIKNCESEQFQQKILPKLADFTQTVQSKFEQALQSSRSTQHSKQNEILDLKSEICSMKNKLLLLEQKKVEEVSTKNLTIQKLEQQVTEEQRRRIEEMDEKERQIEELEKEIENTIEVQMKENHELRLKNGVLDAKHGDWIALQDLVTKMINQDEPNFIEKSELQISDLIQKFKDLQSQNQLLQKAADQRAKQIGELRSEYSTETEKIEEQYRDKMDQLEQKYEEIIEELNGANKIKIQNKEQELNNLKLRMADQIDQISNTLDAHMSQNQNLHDNIKQLREEADSRDIKEKQLLAKIMKLRDERSKLRVQQDVICDNLSDIFQYVNQIEVQLKSRDSHYKVYMDEVQRNYSSREEMLQRVQGQREQLKQVVSQMVTLNESKRCADQETQTLKSEGIQKEESAEPVIIIHSEKDEQYQQILDLLRKQTKNSDDQAKNELIAKLGEKLEILQSIIDNQNKVLKQSYTNNELKFSNSDNRSMMTQQLESSSHSIALGYSQVQKSSGQRSQQLTQRLSSQNLPNITQQSSRETGANEFLDLSMQPEGHESQEELSKFWFGMYQRIKSEFTKEKQNQSEQQLATQALEEELYQIKQKFHFIKNESDTLEKLNAQFQVQLQDQKSKINMMVKTKEFQENENLELVEKVIGELQAQTKNLKGEYLIGIIQKLESVKQNDNAIQLVLKEVLLMFKALLKQLQFTQKEMNKIQKQSQQQQMIDQEKSPLREKANSSVLEFNNLHYQNNKNGNISQRKDINHKNNINGLDNSYQENINLEQLNNQQNRKIGQSNNSNVDGNYSKQAQQYSQEQLSINKRFSADEGRSASKLKPAPQTDRSCASGQIDHHHHHHEDHLSSANYQQINFQPPLPMPSNRKQSVGGSKYQQNNTSNIQNYSNISQTMINMPMSGANNTQISNNSSSYNPVFKIKPGQQLTERQRLELYELRTAAIREIEECESRGKESDPYLKKYVKSIDELLRKTNSNTSMMMMAAY